MNNIQSLFQKMWQDYLHLCPKAQTIHDLFAKQSANGIVVNDHIALRTFNLPKINIPVLAKPFLENGYVDRGDYEFPNRNLVAKHFQHPDTSMPKVFISELLIENFDSYIQEHIKSLEEQVTLEQTQSSSFTTSGRPWSITKNIYQDLLSVSEYAAWVSAFGYKANHFTVSINHLNDFNDIYKLNQFLEDHGYILNKTGGLVKGSPEDHLEQSSTMAEKVIVNFEDGQLEMPGGFYEFAKRYSMSNGKLYQGFVASSADKIFTSTNTKEE